MKKYFVVSDVHSHFTQLKDALDKCGFDKSNKDHVFVSCGDLLDRGDESKECLDFVSLIPNEQKILICGNHEDLLYDAIKRGYFRSHDYHNGAVKTCMNLCNKEYSADNINILNEAISMIAYNKDIENYYDCLKNYAEIGDFICVHGWLPLTNSKKNIKRNFKLCHTKEWEDSRWLNGMDLWYHNIKLKNKTIVCGHWHTSFGNYMYHNKGSGEFEVDSDFSPFIDNGIIALDACTVYTKKVNCIVIEDNKLIAVNGESYDNK